MGNVCVMTGLTEEAQAATSYFDPTTTTVLCGQTQRDNLGNLLPKGCAGIIKFGLCGGLAPPLIVGQFVIADKLVDGSGNIFMPDVVWRKHLFACTRAYEHVWYSSGLYNTADTTAQRAQIFAQTQAYVIDDEGLAVATVANKVGLPFAVVGAISDAFNDTVPRAAYHATNPDGSSSITAVLAYLAANPSQDIEQVYDLVKLANDFNVSLAGLRTAAALIGSKTLLPA